MFTLTVALTTTTNQIQLAFERAENLHLAQKKVREVEGALTNDPPGTPLVSITDDFGQIADWDVMDAAFYLARDVERYWDYLVLERLNKTRAEQKYNQKLGEDPSTKFLVGNHNPKFDR